MSAVVPPTPSPRRRWPLAALGLAAALAAFAWGVIHLFELRFSLGDVYPPYSTLRADPLGAEALLEALAAQSGLRVERNLRPLNLLGKVPFGAPGRDLADDPSLTCFYLGADADEWPFLMETDAVERLETIMRRGGRVVLTFLPAATAPTSTSLDFRRRARLSGSPTPAPRRRGEPEPPPDLIARWKLDFRRTASHRKHDPASPAPTAANHARAVPAAGVPVDPAALSWHSVTDYDLAAAPARDAGWKALYVCEERPVIVARPFGERGGELILAGDSYFLSNEGLRAESHPALLAALVGPARHVIFDESHLGIHEHPGLMTLARRYRLQGALAALGLLAGLFVWRNAVSLVPPTPAAGASGAADAVPGRDGAAGFLNLLRRGVPARDLPAVCLAQWEQARGREPAGAAAGTESAHGRMLERLRSVVREEAARPARHRSAAAAYRAMCEAWQAGKVR